MLSFEEVIQTDQNALESKIGEAQHPSLRNWLDDRARILNTCQVGKHGRTSYQRFKGKKYGGTFMEFGSLVIQKTMDRGAYVRSRFNTLEHLVSRRSDGVVVRTRVVREAPRTVQKSDLDGIVGIYRNSRFRVHL